MTKLNDIIKELSDYCRSHDMCRGCPMDEMDVIKHGDYEYNCPLDAVIDTIRSEINGKTE